MKRKLISVATGIALVIVALATPCDTHAALNKKFYKKAAEKVWSMDLPQFDANADLSDSIFANSPAIFIARLYQVRADYDETANPAKRSSFGMPNSNAIMAENLQRKMVKILEPSALEDFTTFSIDPENNVKFRGAELVKIQHAFGARIHKPDGRVIDVDIDEAITETTGKKNKDAEYKIAIPGLEVGDVLDYFFYTESYIDEFQGPEKDYSIFASIPTRNLTIDYEVSPKLALEYTSINGAPDLSRLENTKDGMHHCRLEINNIQGIDEELPFFMPSRQIPYIEVAILNNAARLTYIPKTARRPGIRKMIYPYLLQDMTSYVNYVKIDKELVGDVVSMAKKWIKAHPEATTRQKADAAWMATLIVSYRAEETIGDVKMSKIFLDALHKLNIKISAQLAASSPRTRPELQELLTYDSPLYFVTTAGDSCYIPDYNTLLQPGDTPRNLDKENMLIFRGQRDAASGEITFESSEIKQFPAAKAVHDTYTNNITARINPSDDEQMLVDMHINAAGPAKQTVRNLLIREDALAMLERYLSAKPDKKGEKGDRQDLEEIQFERAETRFKRISGSSNAKLETLDVKSSGATPDSSNIVIDMKGTVPGLVSMAGRNMVVNIGRLIGRQDELTESQRKRHITVMGYPHRAIYKITFEVPEGYTVDQESLEKINRNITNPTGSFFAMAKLNGNHVDLQVQERYPVSLVPASRWLDMTRILDAAVDFQSASIVLKPL